MSALPRYRCHKEVNAFKIGNLTFRSDGQMVLVPEDKSLDPVIVSTKYAAKHQPKIGGYYVIYDDGYESWSPAEAFEAGYDRI